MAGVAAGSQRPRADIGILTVISFNILINAAVVVAFEDTMVEFARMYNPSLPRGGQPNPRSPRS